MDGLSHRRTRSGVPNAQARLLAELSVTLLLFLIPNASISSGITPERIAVGVNAARLRHAVPVVSPDPALSAAAQQRAEELARNGYAEHNRPDGRPFASAIREAGYPFERAGENIAVGFTHDAPAIRAWQESPAHRRILLNPMFRDTGVGVAHGNIAGTPVVITVQLFGTLQDTILRGWSPLPSALPLA